MEAATFDQYCFTGVGVLQGSKGSEGLRMSLQTLLSGYGLHPAASAQGAITPGVATELVGMHTITNEKEVMKVGSLNSVYSRGHLDLGQLKPFC